MTSKQRQQSQLKHYEFTILYSIMIIGIIEIADLQFIFIVVLLYYSKRISEFPIHSCIKTYISSSSVKLKVVAVTGVDGCLGDDVARKMSTCTSASLVTGGSGCMLTRTDWLIVKHGGRSCLKFILHE